MPAQRKRSRSAADGADKELLVRDQATKKRRIERDADGFIRTIDDEELPSALGSDAPVQYGVMVQPELHVEEDEQQEDSAVVDKKFSFDMTAGFASALSSQRTKKEKKPTVQQPWDFSALTSAEAEQGSEQTTVDEKIARQRAAMQDRDEREGSSEEESLEGDEEDEEDEDERMGEDEDSEEEPNAAMGDNEAVMDFSDLGLSRPLVKACTALGYARPTPIQQRCVPMGLSGVDVCGSAETGSGKTAAFTLPVLERLLFRQRRIPAIRVVILAPTRELAAQCFSMVQKLSQYTDITSCLVVGGLSQKNQETALRARPDIVVATPGRILDHLMNTQSVSLEDVEVLIMDEADRLLDMGFTEEVEEIVRCCPRSRQTMLFSATLSKKVLSLVKISLKDPAYISVNRQLAVAESLAQEIVRVKTNQENLREAMLLALCTTTFKNKTIIFCKAKRLAHRLKLVFGLFKLNAAELHGNLTQAQRLEALDRFKDGTVDFLIATDLASRGLDILGVQTVVNFNLPRTQVQYVHRVGRSARAGRSGRACSLVGDGDRALLKEIVKKAKDQVKQRKLDRELVLKWKGKIEEVEAQIGNIIVEEREERELRLAERDITKGINMIQHRDEIMAKPKKTWFQNNDEKAAAKELSSLAVLGMEDGGSESGGESSEEEEAEEEQPHIGKRQKKRMELRRKEIEAKRNRVPRKKRRQMESMATMEEQGSNEKLVELSVRKAKAAHKPSRLGFEQKPHQKTTRGSKASKGSKKAPKLPRKGGSVFESQVGGAFSEKGKKAARAGSFKSKKRYKRRK